jgi:endonuclease YncB( thermonuclease family)
MSDLCGRLAGLLLACVAFASPAAGQGGPQAGDEITGRGEVIDGRTVAVGGTVLTLWEIESPAFRQRCLRQGEPWECGVAARDQLRDIVRGGELVCSVKRAAESGDPPSARCYLGYSDIAAALIDRGYATALEVWKSPYKQNHREARGSNRGIFSGLFTPPADWRRGQRMKGLETD